MLEQNRVDDLALLYQLLSRVRDGLKELYIAFASYIKVCHYSFMGLEKKPSHFVIQFKVSTLCFA